MGTVGGVCRTAPPPASPRRPGAAPAASHVVACVMTPGGPQGVFTSVQNILTLGGAFCAPWGRESLASLVLTSCWQRSGLGSGWRQRRGILAAGGPGRKHPLRPRTRDWACSAHLA